MAKGRRLKVFQTKLGFYDTVVAAPSQAAALRAWGVHQNLFSDGAAKVTTEPDIVAAAVAHPETPLKRAVGSQDAFQVEAASLPEVPAPARPKAKAPAKAQPARTPARPPADRSVLSAAEAALKSLDDARLKEEAKFRALETKLEADRAAAQATYVAARQAATHAVVEARAAYRKAGGEA